jgi:hypothetical protein
MSPLPSLRLALVVFFVSVVACDRALAHYAGGHFIPEQRMRAAVAAGPGCIVAAGDSRMVAGINLEVFTQAFRDAGRSECVTSIAIGALQIHGISLAVREYLRRGGKPSALVLAVSEDTLIPLDAPPDPSNFTGNAAISLIWSDVSDLRRLYPDFPGRNLREFDAGLRFLLARETGFGSYDSLIWQKVQSVQDRLTGRPKAMNAFGADADMEALAAKMQATAQRRLALTLAKPEEARLDADYVDIERRVHDAGAHLVVVELPMPERYRRTVTESDAGQRYLAWFRERVTRRGDTFVDMTQRAWLSSALFSDFLHLNAEGARRFSEDLGHTLAGGGLSR